MYEKLGGLSPLALATVLVLAACAQDAPTVPGLTPGDASYAIVDSTIAMDSVKGRRILCVRNTGDRVTINESCVTIEAIVGPTTLSYKLDAGGTTPEITPEPCPNAPEDPTQVVIVFGPGLSVGSTISASFGTALQRQSVGPQGVNQSPGHTENEALEVSLCA